MYPGYILEIGRAGFVDVFRSTALCRNAKPLADVE